LIINKMYMCVGTTSKQTIHFKYNYTQFTLLDVKYNYTQFTT